MINRTIAYDNASKAIERQYTNTITLTYNGVSESYTNADITITESFSEDNAIVLGGTYAKELKAKIWEPLRTLDYNKCKITITSELIGEEKTIGIFYPQQVSTQDEWLSVEITAYDSMAKLMNEKYEPTIAVPCFDSDVVADIQEQYNITVNNVGTTTLSACQKFPASRAGTQERSQSNSKYINGYWLWDDSEEAIIPGEEFEPILGDLCRKTKELREYTEDVLFENGSEYEVIIAVEAMYGDVIDGGDSITLSSGESFEFGISDYDKLVFGISFMTYGSELDANTGLYINGVEEISLTNPPYCQRFEQDRGKFYISNDYPTSHQFNPWQTISAYSMPTLVQGHKYVWYCQYDSNYFNISLKWRHDGQEVQYFTPNVIWTWEGDTIWAPEIAADGRRTYVDKICMFELIDLTECQGAGNENLSNWLATYGTTYYAPGEGITVPGTHTLINELVEGSVAQQLGWLAGLQGANAICDNYDQITFKKYTAPATADLNVGREEQLENGISLANEKTVVIDYISAGIEDNIYTAGSGDYGITFENPYITQANVDAIYARENGREYTVGELTWFGNACVQVGDVLKITMKDNTYRYFLCSENEMNLSSGLQIITRSIGNDDAEIRFDTHSPLESKIANVKTTIQEVRADYQKIIDNTEGLYTITTDGQGNPTGWIIKDDLANPTSFVKASLGGLGISTDGHTYATAITGDGIVADSITSGSLKLGGTNDDTILEIYDINNTKIGTWNKTGLNTIGEKHFNSSDYTQNDVNRINNIIRGSVSPTQADYNKYDFYQDGIIDIADYTLCRNIISKNGLTVKWYIKIHPGELNPFNVERELIYGDGTHTNTNIIRINSNEVQFGNSSERHFINAAGQFRAKDVLATDYISAGGGRINDYNLTVQGTGVYAEGAYYNASLEELKTNITPAESMLDVVNEADIYKYDMKKELEKDTHKEHYGFIIGENYNTPNEVLSADGIAIDTYSMISVLWKAVQELSAEVDKLKGGAK